MELKVKFEEIDTNVKVEFEGDIYQVSDGGFERGYAQGLEEGEQQGYTKGYAEGESKGFENGAKSEYDTFWNNYQDNGKLIDYNYAFGGVGWTNKTFKPKYSMVNINGDYMFRGSAITGSLTEILNKLGLELVFNQRYLVQTFEGAYFSEITFNLDPIGLNASTLNRVFYSLPNLESLTINGLRENCSYDNPFRYCRKLTNLIINGTIGKSGVNLQESPLNKASLTNVINALSTSTSGLTVTLGLASVNSAFETSEGANDGSNSAEWKTLADTRKNWTITLS